MWNGRRFIARRRTELSADARDILLLSSDCVLYSDQGLIIRGVSPAAAQLLGYSEFELAGRTLFFVLPDLAPNRSQGKSVAEFLHSGGESNRLELESTCCGRGARFSARVVIGRMTGGESPGLLLAVHAFEDQAQLASAQILARHVSATLDHFLTVVEGNYELVEMAPETSAECIGEIRSACRTMSRTAAGLREFSRTWPEAPAGSDVNAVATEWQNRMEGRVPQPRLAIQLGANLPRVSLHAAEIRTVLDCLFDNVMETDSRDGTITLITQLASDGGVVVELHNQGGGPPQAPDMALFSTTRRSWPSLDLGLATVSSILSARGAHYTISNAEHGTLVRVWLPPVDVAGSSV